MKNLLFNLKAVKTGTHKAQAGAETNSFGSATLVVSPVSTIALFTVSIQQLHTLL
jgi:hypothetical protein